MAILSTGKDEQPAAHLSLKTSSCFVFEGLMFPQMNGRWKIRLTDLIFLLIKSVSLQVHSCVEYILSTPTFCLLIPPKISISPTIIENILILK